MKDTAQINKQIAFIAKAGARLDAYIQETAEAVCVHFGMHNDTGLVNRLFLALPRGARKAAMQAWLEKYLAVVPNTNNATAKEQPFVYDREGETNPVECCNEKWFDMKPEKPVNAVFDFAKFVKQALKKYGEAETTNMTVEQAHALAALAGVPDSDVPTRPVTAKA